MTVLASAQGPSYESRGYGGPLYVGPNFQSGGQHAPPVYGPKSSNDYKKKRATQTSKERKAPAAKETDTAKSAPVESSEQTENSSISLVPGGETSVEKENSSISHASLEGDKPAETGTDGEKADASKTSQSVGCKKYFPSAGMTLSVPCE
jgi:hypothetical protein